nr:MAG TPA: immunity protein [Caudoviricetes sp.]
MKSHIIHRGIDVACVAFWVVVALAAMLNQK